MDIWVVAEPSLAPNAGPSRPSGPQCRQRTNEAANDQVKNNLTQNHYLEPGM